MADRMRGGAEPPDDEALVAGLLDGSTAALGQLFRRHGNDAYRLALRITGSPEEAEDVVQDVFTGLRRALARYEERGSFPGWLRKLTTRTALMRMRRRHREQSVPMDVLARRSDGVDVAGIVDRLVVRAALDELPEGQRRVFLLREVEGYSHEEIAEMLEISSASSRVRLHRAWKLLERRVQGR